VVSTPPERVGTQRLMERHGIRPDTDLGQHFLLDENLVDLAMRMAEVGPDDVVLEVGAGLGTLTAALGRTARAVHALEVDPRMRDPLAESTAGLPGVHIHWGDCMKVDLGALDPPPTKVVSNLPYHVATPVLIETICRLPGVTDWALMTQREVADRWLAPPGTRLYGGPSVVVQLACRSTGRRTVGREVFSPRPRVDSALVGLHRIAPAPDPATRSLVRAAFAVRRKTIVNALGQAGADRDAVRAALVNLGLGESARPEQLAPADYPRLAAAIQWQAPDR
jgi:16S rRNA (adenine1518-N6/adenine1519-N6)-dimethyltransferase